MSDPTNLNQTMAQKVATKLSDIGVPEAKHAEKIGSAKFWWSLAALTLFAAVLLLGGAATVVGSAVLKGGAPSVPVLIVLAGPGVLAGLAGLFCASQADGEATRAFLTSLPMLRGLFAKVDA